MRACARFTLGNMLELRDVRAGYGDAVVLDGISLALELQQLFCKIDADAFQTSEIDARTYHRLICQLFGAITTPVAVVL